MTQRVRILQTVNGAPDPGTHTYTYLPADGKGHSGIYDVEDELARVFLEFGYAEAADDYEPKEGEELPTPEGQPIPETEQQRREREAAEAASGEPTPPQDLSIVDADHYPAAADAIEQTKAEKDAAAQGAPAPAVEVADEKLTRKELDAAAKKIGLDTVSLPNKDAVRQAIADAQGD